MTDRAGWHYTALARRLILATLSDDEDACRHIAVEVGDCVHCWESVALAVAFAAVSALRRVAEVDGTDPVRAVEGEIAYALDKFTDPA
ncbi:hypothetical protein [Mycobacterium sp. E3198]|uniref:hypothetical protein n=1 Tax=Mycobacterium sp. E3198 TaxID=1834143 RepID=UPI00080094BC|nr:hypothetical protein [Mycobacterium sp. E3198]OBG25432.1 hypothetical protein A5673_09100 [Mycobacterium sp. E3198]